MARELHSRMYLWLGVSTLAVGIGAALASGSGVAQADSTSSSSPGPAKPGHHQAAAAPSHSAASPMKSAKNKSSGSHLAVAKPGIVSSAVALHVEKADKSTAAADNPTDLEQALAAQSQAITAQGQTIAAQGQAIANEEKTFGSQVQNYFTTTNFSAIPPTAITTEVLYAASSAALLAAGQVTSGFAIDLNAVARAVTAMEASIISLPGGLPYDRAVFAATTPIANLLKSEANWLAGASATFYVTAGTYEAGFIQNLPQQYPTFPA